MLQYFFLILFTLFFSQTILSENNNYSFQWKPVEAASSYRLEIRNAKKEIIYSKDQRINIAEINLPEDIYEFRIGTLNRNGVVLDWTKWQGPVEKISNMQLHPILLFPMEAEKLDMSYKEWIVFQWEKIDPYNNYYFTLNKFTNGELTPILQKEVQSNSYVLKQLEILDEGIFYWGVVAMDKSKKAIPIKPKRELQLFLSKKLDHIKPSDIITISPKNQYID